MATSPEFTNDSSFDWSASYRFNIQGLTAVRPLPGQTKVAFPNASLGGTNFQSHPHGLQPGPYHSRGALPPLQASQQRVRTGYHTRPVPPFAVTRQPFQRAAQHTHHRDTRKQPEPALEEDAEQYALKLQEVIDSVHRWRVDVGPPDCLSSPEGGVRLDTRESASEGDSHYSDQTIELPAGVPVLRLKPKDTPQVQTSSGNLGKAKKSTGSSNSVFDFDPAPVNLIAQAHRVIATTPGDVQAAHPNATGTGMASEELFGPGTRSPSNKSETPSSFGSPSPSSLSPVVLEATLEAPKYTPSPAVSSRQAESIQRESAIGAVKSPHRSPPTSAKHSPLEATQAARQSGSHQDRISVPKSFENHERLQVPKTRFLTHAEPEKLKTGHPDLAKIDVVSPAFGVNKGPMKTAPSIVSSASSGVRPESSRINPSGPPLRASISAADHTSVAQEMSPAESRADSSPKHSGDEHAAKNDETAAKQANSYVSQEEAPSPPHRGTPFFERPSILRNSSYMSAAYQPANPRKSVTFQDHLSVLPDASVSSVHTGAHSDTAAALQMVGGSTHSASLRSSGFSKRRQPDEEDLDTESSDGEDPDPDPDPEVKQAEKHSFDPRPVELIARPMSEGSVASSQRAESKPLPPSSTASKEIEAKKKEGSAHSKEKRDLHGLPSDFYQAPKRPVPKVPPGRSETGNPYRATVEDEIPEKPLKPRKEAPRREPKAEIPQKKPSSSKSSDNFGAGRDPVRPPPQQPYDERYKPSTEKKAIHNMYDGMRYPSSDLLMPDLPDKPIAKHTLGCSSVTMALHKCRGSSVYKSMRDLVGRFHLDLEDLNKRRQRQWLPLTEHCRDLVTRMMSDLRNVYVFRDRWERKRYRQFLGSEDGSDDGTIFYMFKISLAWIRLGSRYAFEAQRELQRISDQSNEEIQAASTSNTYIPVALFDQRRVIASVSRIDQYFKDLAKDTEDIETLLRLALYRLEKMEIERMLNKKAGRHTPADLHRDAMLRGDLIAWFNLFLSSVLRPWEKSLSDSAYEDSLKRFRNYDREWEEEGPNFGLLRSMFCLGMCLPREYRTKLVNWHFVDNDPKLEDEKTVAIEEDSDGGGEEGKRARGRSKLGKRRRLLDKTLGVVERIAERFAEKEDIPDEASQDSSDEEASPAPAKAAATRYTPPVRTTRRATPSPGDHMMRRSSGAASSEKSKRGSVHRSLAEPVAQVNKEFLQDTRELLQNIRDQPYRDACLRAIEGLMSLIAEGGSLPTQSEIAPVLALSSERKPRKEQSKKLEEWTRLDEFMDSLAIGGFTKRELWQIYLNVLEEWDAEFEGAMEDYQDLCQSPKFLASLDRPLNWPVAGE